MLIIFWILILGAVLIKKPKFFPALVTIFLMKINYNAFNVADFSDYSNIYNQITSNNLYQTGYGWYILNNFGKSLGLDYNLYKCFSILICTIIIWSVSRILVGENLNIIAGLYLLYPALIDTIQIRFFTAMTLTLIGILFLEKQKVWSTIVFIIIVLFASTIHTSALFYLVFAMYPIINKNANRFKYLIISISVLLIIFRKELLSFISRFSNNRQMQYFDSTSGVTSGSRYVLLIAIISIIIMYLINSQIYQIISTDTVFSDNDKKTASIIKNISLMFFLLIPLVILSNELFRVFRISFILSYILIAILNKKDVNYHIKHLIYNGKNITINIRILSLLMSFIAFLINILYLAPDVLISYF